MSASAAYARAVSEWTRICRCCRQPYVREIRPGRPAVFCEPCRRDCLIKSYALRASSPHRSGAAWSASSHAWHPS